MGLKNWAIKEAITGKLPLWMYKLLGKITARKLDLTEGNSMADTPVTEVKPWYKSKAKLAAIVGVLVAAVQPISTAFGHPIAVPTWVLEFLGGVGLYGVRDAISK